MEMFKMVKEDGIMKERVKFKDLYNLYPNKWVITVNDTWKEDHIDTCEVFGDYDTKDDAIDAVKKANIKSYGRFKMVKEEGEIIKERVKFKDLYDLYPNKWVITINDEWENGDINTSEVYGVYETEEDMFQGIDKLKASGFTSWGMFKLVREEDELGFIFVVTS